MVIFQTVIISDGYISGRMEAVLRRRHGQVLHSDIQEGSQTFNVTAVVPVIESFEFANEIRKQTSGKASPQLVFSDWEVSTYTKVYIL